MTHAHADIAEMTKTAAIVLTCLALCACNQNDQATITQKKEPSEATRKLIAPLPDDPMLAAAELEKRLGARVSVSAGLVFVNDPTWGTHVVSGNTPWIVNCGKHGVSVTLGMAVSRDDGELHNAVHVVLSLASVEPSTCSVASLMLAKNIQALFRGADSQEPKAGAGSAQSVPFPGPGGPQDRQSN